MFLLGQPSLLWVSDLVSFWVSEFIVLLWIWVCQSCGHNNPLILLVEVLHLSRHACIIFSLTVCGMMYDSRPGYLVLFGRCVPRVDVDNYHLTGVADFFFALLFFHHFEPLPWLIPRHQESQGHFP